MDSKRRLTRQALGQEVDHVPSIGGWIGGAKVLADLAGMSLEAYLADPYQSAIRGNKAMGVDGMVGLIYHEHADQIRVGAVEEQRFVGIEPEAILAYAATLPETEKQVLASFDAAAVEAQLRQYFAEARRDWMGMEPIPNFWDLGGHFPLYHQFGYVAFLSACALYPEAVGKIWWVRSLHSHEKAKILARLYSELDLVPLLFCGEDLCNNQGPMVSPDFLRRYYLPTVKMILSPLVERQVRIVCHCDGDVRPIIEDVLACGFSGLQGFQFELGINPYQFRDLRPTVGEKLLFFTGMSVTCELPFGTPDDVRDEIDWCHHWTDGGRGMFVFTSNVTGVEVPPANIRAGYAHAQALGVTGTRLESQPPWPWGRRSATPALTP